MLFTVESKMQKSSQKVRYITVRGTEDGIWKFCHVLWIQGCVKCARGAVANDRSGPK